MIIFATPAYFSRFIEPLQALDPKNIAGECEILRFPNGEMHALVHTDVNNQDCLIVGSTAPPDQQLLSILMLTNALRRNGAQSVQLFLPYMGYSRQDKPSPGESNGIAAIGLALLSAGVSQIFTIDVHSALDQELIGLPLRSIPATALFVPVIKALNWGSVTIVAPDEGAIARCQASAGALGNHKLAHFVKKHTDGIVDLELVGDVGKRAIIVDDIIDSGRTLISACKQLRKRGTQEIAITVTHGLFNGDDWKQLFELGVAALYTSDSYPAASDQTHPGVHVVSLARLLPFGNAINER